jgi:uncharacterized protein (TIGR02588 family)
MASSSLNKDGNVSPLNRDKIPRLEWLISGIGLALVCLSLAFLLYKALGEDSAPPGFQAKLLECWEQEMGFHAKVEIRNMGGETAGNLEVLVTLEGASGPEPRRVVIDYLPPYSARIVGVVFSERATEENLTFLFGTYTEP